MALLRPPLFLLGFCIGFMAGFDSWRTARPLPELQSLNRRMVEMVKRQA